MSSSLRSRLAVLLFLANLPAILLAVVVAFHSYRTTRELREHGVGQAAELIATRVSLDLAVARNVLSTLANNPNVTGGGPTCQAILLGALVGRSGYQSLIVADAEGRRLCGAGSEDVVLAPETLGRVAEGRLTAEALPLTETGDGNSLVFAAQPARAPDGGQRVLALILRRDTVRSLLSDVHSRRRQGAALIRGDGREVTSIPPSGLDEGWLPSGGTVPAFLSGPTTLSAQSRQGREFFYTVSPVASSSASIVVGTPMSEIAEVDGLALATTLGVPLLMTLIGIAVAFIGMNDLVLRWISRLVQATGAYSRGDYAPRIDGLDQAPRELAELGVSFNGMAARIDERSKALEEALGGKNRLLKELHHRVKNNFQMIASLLALQRRELPDRQRMLLRVPEDRVLAMAAAYKASYASGEIGRVGLAELFRDVATQLRHSFGLPPPLIQVKLGAEDITLDLDRAVPLGLLVSEIITAQLDKPGGAQRPIRLEVVKHEGEDITIVLSAEGVADAVPDSGLRGRLVVAYIAQLAAAIERPSPDSVQVRMPIDLPTQARPGRVELGA